MLRGSDIFDLYRRSLLIIVGTYAAVRAVSFFWRWQVATGSARRAEALARRYLVVQVLKLRVSRFTIDLLQIVVLAAVLAYLIRLHWR